MRFLLGERQIGKPPSGTSFHGAITPLELGIAAAQRFLGVYSIRSHQIDRGEKEIAGFFQNLVRGSVAKFLDLLYDLGLRAPSIGPIETLARGAFLELLRAHERW